VLGSDGSGACSLYVPAGGSRVPTSAETVANRGHYVKMQGRDVFRFATRVVPESVIEALDQAGLTTAAVALVRGEAGAAFGANPVIFGLAAFAVTVGPLVALHDS